VIKVAVLDEFRHEGELCPVEVIAVRTEDIEFCLLAFVKDRFLLADIYPPKIVSSRTVEKRPVVREVRTLFNNIPGPSPFFLVCCIFEDIVNDLILFPVRFLWEKRQVVACRGEKK